MPSPRGDGAATLGIPDPARTSRRYIAAIIAGPYSVVAERGDAADGRTIPLGLFTRASLASTRSPR